MLPSILINKKKIFSIINSLQGITSKRTISDHTQNIIIEINEGEIVLKATDLEVFFQASFYAENKLDLISFQDSISINSKRFLDSIRDLDELIYMYVDEQKITLQTDTTETVLIRHNLQKDFPESPKSIINFMEISKPQLLESLSKTTSFALQNSSHIVFNSVLIEMSINNFFSITATDGHCLAHIKTYLHENSEDKADSSNVNHRFLISKKSAQELKKILDDIQDEIIFVGTADNYVSFSGKNFNFFSKTISEKFPDYSKMLKSEGYNQIIVNKNDFEKTIKRSISFIAGKFIPFSLLFNKNDHIMTVSLSNKEVGTIKDKINIKLNTVFNQNFYLDSILLYPPYVFNAVSNIITEEVCLFFDHGKKPIIIKNKLNKTFISFVIMPIIHQN